MLYPLLSPHLRFPALGILLNGIYYGLILTGVLVAATAFYGQLSRTGADSPRLRAFVVLSSVMAFPLGWIGSRAANMFYFPPAQWNFSFFAEQWISGPHHTFHASLLLPLVFVVVLAGVYRYRRIQVADTLFLYLPLGHAIARFGCFLVGCCWGHPVSIDFWGRKWSFHNPVPLYEILLNLLLFLVLRFQYQRVYGVEGQSEPNGGQVTALYLIGYGGGRMLLETIRTEPVVGGGWTLAQWSMMGFMLAGMGMLACIRLRKRVATDALKRNTLKKWRLCWFLGSLSMVAGVSLLLLHRNVVPWPFHGAESVAGTWGRVLVYLPFFIFSLASLRWIRGRPTSLRSYFRMPGISWPFLVGLVVSISYTAYLYLSCGFALKSPAFAAPAMTLGLLNAMSEEILFRLVLFQLLLPVAGSWKPANLIQAFLYAIPHLFIGGPVFFSGALGYGLLLGWITRSSGSLTPAMICHFVIDLGAVGLPLLVVV